MAVKLSWFQAKDLEFYVKQKFGLVLYKPRVGKTFLATAFTERMNARRIIVVAPKHAFAVWLWHFYQWYGNRQHPEPVRVIYVRGDAAKRQQAYRAVKTPERTVFITTYASFQRDIDVICAAGITCCIYDEAGKRLVNRKTKNFACAMLLRKATLTCGLILSGTLIDKHAGQFWAPLHWCAPRLFKSYWDWFSKFVLTQDNGFGMEILGNKNVELMHQQLRHWAIARKRDVTTCPPKRKELWEVEMTKEQAALYKALDTDMMAFTDRTTLVASTSLEKQLRLRQLLTCPQILDPNLGIGGALESIVEELDDLPDEDRHCVIFTSFRKALDPFERYLKANGHKHIIQLHGGLEPEDQTTRLDYYKRTRGIALVVIESAEAYSLAPATLAYFVGYSWSPSSNEQAEDRLIPQTGDPVTIKYACYEGTVDKAVAIVVGNKFDNVEEATPYESH